MDFYVRSIDLLLLDVTLFRCKCASIALTAKLIKKLLLYLSGFLLEFCTHAPTEIQDDVISSNNKSMLRT